MMRTRRVVAVPSNRNAPPPFATEFLMSFGRTVPGGTPLIVQALFPISGSNGGIFGFQLPAVQKARIDTIVFQWSSDEIPATPTLFWSILGNPEDHTGIGSLDVGQPFAPWRDVPLRGVDDAPVPQQTFNTNFAIPAGIQFAFGVRNTGAVAQDMIGFVHGWMWDQTMKNGY